MDRETDRKQLIMDYRETFGSEGGKRVLADLKKNAHYNVAYFPAGNDNHTDIYEVCREEGKRAVIVHIDLMLEKDPYKETGDLITRKEE